MAYTVTPGGAPIISLVVVMTSSEENRHTTDVAGLCKVTVGYRSSADGTSNINVVSGSSNRPGCRDVGEMGPFSFPPVVVVELDRPTKPPAGNTDDDMGSEPGAPDMGNVETGGETITPFTFNRMDALIITPSQVS